jgi:hypothetical protein
MLSWEGSVLNSDCEPTSSVQYTTARRSQIGALHVPFKATDASSLFQSVSVSLQQKTIQQLERCRMKHWLQGQFGETGQVASPVGAF